MSTNEPALRRQTERGEALLSLFERVIDRDWPEFRNSNTKAVMNLDEKVRTMARTLSDSEADRPRRQRVLDIWMAGITALLVALLLERLISRLMGRHL